MRRLARPALLLGLALFASPARAENPVVRFTTTLGNFDVELCNELSTLCLGIAPGTVENFLGYVDRGDYADTIVHRSIAAPFYGADFVIQGGGYFSDGTVVREIPTLPPATNEPNQSNKRGTIAMARNAAVNSATDQWFVNLADNGGVPPNGLDYQNEGFTVFGVVMGDGMQTVDAISDNTPYQLTNAALSPIYESDAVRANFNSAPMLPGFVPANVTIPPLPEQILPFFITTSITRVPEPGTAFGSAVALAALAVLTRRRA